MDMGFTDPRQHEEALDQPDSDAPLRPLGWTDLCARLAAGQDFRRFGGLAEMSSADRSVASFHRSTARWLAAPGESGNIVNPMSSTNGKAAGETVSLASVAACRTVAPVPVEPSFSSRMR
jgi:hypothetical protein